MFKRISVFICLFVFIFLFFSSTVFVFPQATFQNQYVQQTPVNQNNANRSAAFRQEIARFDISVWRDGKNPLPISQVPRVQAGDVIKVKMLEEVVGGIKPDQSLYNWTFIAAFVNPNRNKTDENSVSQEVVFRKTGWYREYSFKVPFDSQPLFFLYPKPNYRDKVLKLLSKNYEEVQKLGEKTIEIAGAYAQIGLFLNELQGVLNSNYYGYNNNNRNYNNYNNNYNYNPYNNGYYNYPNNSYYNLPNPQIQPEFQFNYNLLMAQSVERLARSFNIQLPQNCWQTNTNSYGTNGSYNNGYNNYGNGANYNTGANNYGYNNYGYNNYGNNNNFGYGINNDLISRVQCIAKSVRIEDLDLSVARLLQQGGVLAAAQLAQKYPQIAYWINIAAAAIDLILKITKKNPLRIVPTITQANGNSLVNSPQYNNYNQANQNSNNSYQTQNNQSQNQQNYTNIDNNGGFGNTVGNTPNNFPQPPPPQNQVNLTNRLVVNAPPSQNNPASKISVFADTQPDDNQFVTAYPIVVQKWQPNADFEVISLRPPVLMEPCLHSGINILKHTDLNDDQLSDNFTREYVLQMSAENGFKKDFPLKKNVGLGGWELNISPEEVKTFPIIQMSIEAVIKGKRGFNEISSPPFKLPVSIGGKWEITKDSQDLFAVGERRRITLRNQLGSCQCLERVVYRPSFGGEFVFETNQPVNNFSFSPDNKEVSFDVDTTNFKEGDGQFELKTYGGESTSLKVKLYPQLPEIAEVKIAKGDGQVTLNGENLEQIQSIKISGRSANAVANGTPNPKTNPLERAFPSRTFLFQNPSQKITENTVSIELILDNTRTLKLIKNFPVQAARPTILTNDNKEIEGIAFDRKVELGLHLTRGQKKTIPQIDLSGYPIFSVNTNEIRLTGQNVLTDYDFKVENLSVETRIEKSVGDSRFGKDIELPKVSFEVLDFANVKISFQINEQLQKMLGGRRIQFRLRDSERGDSDWFTIKQTFVRTPKIESVNCNLEQSGQCELKGEGLDYISHISFDNGQTWLSKLTFLPTTEGKSIALIPYLGEKNFLKLRLRDYPQTEGIPVSNYEYSPALKIKRIVPQNKPTKVVQSPDILRKQNAGNDPTSRPVNFNKPQQAKPQNDQNDFLNGMEIDQIPIKQSPKIIKP